MILCNEHREPLAVSVIVSASYLNESQVVRGHLKLLGEPKMEKTWCGDDDWSEFSEEPIGIVFVPECCQRVKESLL